MMAVDERERHDLYTRLVDALGEEAAVTLMNHLPPTGWADVATKHDVTALGRELRAEMHREFAELRAELGGEVAGLRGEMYEQMAKQTRVYIYATLTAVVATGGLAFGAAGLV